MSESSEQEIVEECQECLFCGKKPEFEDVRSAGKLVMFIHECSVVKYRVSPFRSESAHTIRTWNKLMEKARNRALEHFKKAA